MSEFGEFAEAVDVPNEGFDNSFDFGSADESMIDIPEDIEVDDISADAISSDTPLDVDVDFSEQDSFERFLIDEATENGLIEDIPEDIELEPTTDVTRDNVISENEFDWALENLSADQLGQLKEGIISEDIKVEPDLADSEEDTGYARVRR